jgi:hypothetical protein
MCLFASRTHLSPKKSTKKLLLDGDTMDDNGDGCADGAAIASEPRYCWHFLTLSPRMKVF